MARQYRLQARVTDPSGNVVTFEAVVSVDEVPIIDAVTANPSPVRPGEKATVTITARDPEGQPLTYALVALDGGAVAPTAQPHVFEWTAPAA